MALSEGWADRPSTVLHPSFGEPQSSSSSYPFVRMQYIPQLAAEKRTQ